MGIDNDSFDGWNDNVECDQDCNGQESIAPLNERFNDFLRQVAETDGRIITEMPLLQGVRASVDLRVQNTGVIHVGFASHTAEITIEVIPAGYRGKVPFQGKTVEEAIAFLDSMQS